MFRPQDMPQKVSKAQALPAPVGGLNDLDPLAMMDASYLIDGVNFYPDTGNLMVRYGYQEWCTGFGSAVKTIMQYAAQDGTFHKFACTDLGIYDANTSMANPPKVAASTFGSWEYTNYATPNTQYLVACNGQDPPKLYNNATWVDFKQVTTPANPGEIAGVDPTTFCYVLSHMHRLWFAQKNSMTIWYLPVDSVGGTAYPIFLGSIFRKGGYVVGMSRWSSDSGSGIADRLVIFTSSGEIAAYEGTDPSSASTWQLDAIFFIGAPLSRRSFMEYGGDVIILTKRGVIPTSTLLSSNAPEVIFSGAMSRRISRTLVGYTSNVTFPFPPEIMTFPDNAWIMVNINKPSTIRDPTTYPVQLVMNILTGAWGRFDYPIDTMRSTDKGLMMGTPDGRVILMTVNQYLDGVHIDGTGGNPISAYAMCAYTYLDDPTFNKHAQFVRPVFQADVKPSFIIRVLPDFRLDLWSSVPTPNLAVGNAVWDITKWDMANWAGNENVYRPWCSANVLGYAFAWQLKVSTSSSLGLSAVEWVWENGDYV